MKSSNLYDFLDTCYDFNSQEEWDQSGMVSFNDASYDNNKVVIALEITNDLIDFCIDNEIKLIVCHHPLYTKTLSDEFSPNHKFVKRLFDNQIDVIAIHTPFDKDVNGMNVALAQKLRLRDIKRLNETNKYVITGSLVKPQKIEKFAKFAKEILNSDFATYIDSFKNNIISKVAICGGSGGSFITEVAAQNDIDLYITCDVKHHVWNDAYELRTPILDLNHDIENVFISVLSKKVKDYSPHAEIFKYVSRIKKNII